MTRYARKSGPRHMAAKFASACGKCGGWMPVGSPIVWEPGTKAVHETCPAVPAPRPVIEFRPVAPIVEAAEAAAASLPSLREAEAEAEGAWVAAVIAAGACPACEGTGEVPCPECRGTGSVRVMSDVWDSCRPTVPCLCGGGKKAPREVAREPAVEAASRAWSEARGRVSAAEGAEAHAESVVHGIRKGAHVIVVRGRKVAVGTTGTVIWVGEGRFGERCGVKDAAGTVHWTAVSNVEVSEIPTEVPAKAA